MITNFEELTHDLSYEEKKIAHLLVLGLVKRTEKNPIKAPEIVEAMSNKLGVKFTEARLRKMINYIRRKGLLPVIATPKGYFTTNDKEEILKEIQSLTDRAAGIMAAADGLKAFLT